MGSLSSGQRKRACFEFLMTRGSMGGVLVDPWEHLDGESRAYMQQRIDACRDRFDWTFISRRWEDLPDWVDAYYRELEAGTYRPAVRPASAEYLAPWQGDIPGPPSDAPVFDGKVLFEMNKVCVSYHGRPVLRDVDWTVETGESWWLRGPNGSGKSTLISMIAGDNQKAYGQDITLFGLKKGQGESVWDLKRYLGYYTPGQIEHFRSSQSLLDMVASGFQDSVGLYRQATDEHLGLSREWIGLLGLSERQGEQFRNFSTGEKNLIMTLRAMVKHPPLVILDEPTTGLNSAEAMRLAQWVGRFCRRSRSALIWVSHGGAQGLAPEWILDLVPGELGSSAHAHRP